MEIYTLRVGNKGGVPTTFRNGSLYDITEDAKRIIIPFKLEFKNNGYDNLIEKLVEEEKQKNVNKVFDKETVKFSLAQYDTTTKTSSQIKFKFYSNSDTTYSDSFINAGFEQAEINELRNSLTKSFFRLDFYDSTDEKNQNLMFSEFINVGINTTPNFVFDRIFWYKNDTKFTLENTYRSFYFNVTFFDAKTGNIKKFINKDLSQPLTLTQFKNNQEWRYCEVKILNPNSDSVNSSKNKIFYIEPINGNTDGLITFSELRIV